MIEAMVDRFLGWKLPDDFMPDAGISFTPLPHPNGWPIGTNLLSANQAKAMFEHCLQGITTPAPQSAQDGEAVGWLPAVAGVSRISDNERALLLACREVPTDDQMRGLHDFLRTLQRSPRGKRDLREYAIGIASREVDILTTTVEALRAELNELRVGLTNAFIVRQNMARGIIANPHADVCSRNDELCIEVERLQQQLAASQQRVRELESAAFDVCLAGSYDSAKQAVIHLNTVLRSKPAPAPAASAERVEWHKPAPVTAELLVDALVVLPAIRQDNGCWWIYGRELDENDVIAWALDTPAVRAAIAKQSEVD